MFLRLWKVGYLAYAHRLPMDTPYACTTKSRVVQGRTLCPSTTSQRRPTGQW